eukprot:CAMPEP_0194210472 /NCGR_PEP_ID=MMETSP0156-20130528/8554_1 /TAXON_ID=33649 /ORGANISM="Thalassionema nitzschioides, Strain L26-B" /LENGTH=66 /DNA_ID=CAMNT_0038937821 /DNA_START=59 /DNA_END=259 /DNA_ORIENTATION=-
MPWQPVASMLIIGGMVNVTAGLMWGINRLYFGPGGRKIMRDEYDFNLENRDLRVLEYRKMLAEAAK